MISSKRRSNYNFSLAGVDPEFFKAVIIFLRNRDFLVWGFELEFSERKILTSFSRILFYLMVLFTCQNGTYILYGPIELKIIEKMKHFSLKWHK